MVKIKHDLALDILAHMECAGKNCSDCRICDDCEQNQNTCTSLLRDAIAAAEREPKITPYNVGGFYTPECRMPAATKASEYITISVAEYHFLTKVATLLEAIMECDGYHRDGTVLAVHKILQGMKRPAEAGAEE